MGRYVHGTKGFSYKYVFGAQPTNLTSLAGWSGIAQPEACWSLGTQFYAPYSAALEERADFVTGVGDLTAVYAAAVPPFDLVADVESAIYQVGERWAEVIQGIDAALPGPAIRPDLAGGQSFSFGRTDWATLAERIGHDADPDSLESLEAARQAALEAGTDDYLAFMAACALHHAVAHDLDRFEMVDTEPRQTNLWSVVQDYAHLGDDASWEQRVAHGQLQGFLGRRDAARAELQPLVDARPTDLWPARALFAAWLWEEQWGEIGTLADKLLAADQDDANRGELLLWRGEAAWVLEELESARADGDAAAELGRTELRDALQEGATEL